jgi:hexulose-6-phosphate isomerase
MKKGINAWHFASGTPLAVAARAARAAGFEAFEPTLNPQGELTAHTPEVDCRQLAEHIRDTGLEITALACGMFWTISLTSRDAQVRGEAYDLALACLDRARWLGAPVVLIVPGVVSHFQTGGFESSYADALRYAFDALRKLSFEAEARGVIIGIENVWNQFLVSPVEMRDFIDRINSPWVAAYFDVGNVLRYGIPQDWILTLGKRIARVHVKDFRVRVGTIDGFCSIGDGDVDWPAVMAALRFVGYDGPLTFEGRGELADISKRLDTILR